LETVLQNRFTDQVSDSDPVPMLLYTFRARRGQVITLETKKQSKELDADI